MQDKTIVLRKQAHWYIINSQDGSEEDILRTLLQYSQLDDCNLEEGDIHELLERLGWELEVHSNLKVA